MSADGRCDCGSRVFLTQTLSVTTSEGDIYGLNDFKIGNCLRCNRRICIKGGNGEQKVVSTFPAGMDGERLALTEALQALENKDHPGEANYLLRTPQDKEDLKRLSITGYK